jgi:hypothetical protein
MKWPVAVNGGSCRDHDRPILQRHFIRSGATKIVNWD